MDDPSCAGIILCGLRDAENARRVLAWVGATFQGSDSALIAVHVITPSDAFLRDLSPDGLTTWRLQRESQMKREWLSEVRASGFEVVPRVVHGEGVATGILRIADETKPDFIVVGAANHPHVAAPVGQRIAQLAHQPVVIVPRRWGAARSGDQLRTPA